MWRIEYQIVSPGFKVAVTLEHKPSNLDKVHQYGGSRGNLDNQRMLLERCKIWSVAAAKYLCYQFGCWSSCSAAFKLQPCKKVSHAFLNRHFSYLVCSDQVFFDNILLFNGKDARIQYFAENPCYDLKITTAVRAFKKVWHSSFGLCQLSMVTEASIV